MKSLSLNRPHLLVMVGVPGSGKTFFAEKFAATFQAPYVKYDTILKISGHNTATSDVFAGYLLRQLFKTNHTIVFDGPTATRDERTAIKDLAVAAGYACMFIWVQTDPATAKDRYIKSNRKIGHHVTPSQYDILLKNFVAPVAKEHPFIVISGKHTYATQAKAVLQNLTMTKQSARAEKPHNHTVVVGSKRIITIR